MNEAGAERVGEILGDVDRGARVWSNAAMRAKSTKARGRKVTEDARAHPDWVPDLGGYDSVIINSSGGKDSEAMLARVVEVADRQGIPRESLVVVHADLGQVEWKGTKEVAQEQAAAYGLRFEVVKRAKGQDLLQHIEDRYYQLANRIEDTKALGGGTWRELAALLPSKEGKPDEKRAALEAAVAALAARLPDKPLAMPPGFEDNPLLRETVSRQKRAEYLIGSIGRKVTGGADPDAVADWGAPNPWPGDNRYCTSEHKRAAIRPLVTGIAERIAAEPLEKWRTARAANRRARAAEVSRRAKATGLKGPALQVERKRLAGVVAAAMPDPQKPKPPRVLNAMGLRAQESSERANAGAISKNDATSGAKVVDDWLPIQGWTEEQVWDRIAAEKLPVHHAYSVDPATNRPDGSGMRRLSCVFCVYADDHDLTTAARENPRLFEKYLELEARTGFTFQQGKFKRGAVAGLAGKPKSLAAVAEALREHRNKREAPLGLVQIGEPRGRALAKALAAAEVHTLASAIIHNVEALRAAGERPIAIQYDHRASGAVVQIDTEGFSYYVGRLGPADAYPGTAGAAAAARFHGLDYHEHGAPNVHPRRRGRGQVAAADELLASARGAT